MKISFNLTLRCSLCGALINLTGEETKSDPFLAKKLGRRPEPDKPHIKWRLDGKLIKKLNDARRFVLTTPIVEGSYLAGEMKWFTLVPEYVKILYHKSLGVGEGHKVQGSTHVAPCEFRYIKCLACGGRAYLGSGNNATE